MSHRYPEMYIPGVGEIPPVVITDEVTIAEDTLIREGSATRAYVLHAVRLREISTAGTARSKVAETLLAYIAARMELEHDNYPGQAGQM